MATITYGNVGVKHGTASTVSEVISIRAGKNQEMIDVTSMTVEAQEPRVYVPGLVGGEATVEAYGDMPDRGVECSLEISATEVFAGKVVSTGTSGQVGGVITHTCTIRLAEEE